MNELFKIFLGCFFIVACIIMLFFIPTGIENQSRVNCERTGKTRLNVTLWMMTKMYIRQHQYRCDDGSIRWR